MSKKNIVTSTTTNLLLSVLSFIIILLCLNIEDAQGQQYQARSNLHFQNSLRRRADQFRQQHQHTVSLKKIFIKVQNIGNYKKYKYIVDVTENTIMLVGNGGSYVRHTVH